ncbi:MAG: nitrogen fixation protein [Chamaesiphon sp.]|nr:nitrogen fixation protein [Chamaesiphon sp.]
MTDLKKASVANLCPSAPSDSEEGFVFGMVSGTIDEPKISYLKESQPSHKLISKVGSRVEPGEVLRIAAPCEEKSCQHLNGQDCRLVKRVVEDLPVVAENLPPCAIRRHCQWWNQEGISACLRCPQVITRNYRPSKLMIKVAAPQPYIEKNF